MRIAPIANTVRASPVSRRRRPATMPRAPVFRVATCIGCGCNDFCACVSDETGQPCAWLAVDRAAKVGVCSECPDDLVRWNAGDRSGSVPL